DKIQLAVGSAGFDGKGPMSEKVQGHSVHRALFSKTESINDFIFGVIVEEFGFQGAVLQIGATALLLLQCVFVSFYARDPLAGLLMLPWSLVAWLCHLPRIVSALPDWALGLGLMAGGFGIALIFGRLANPSGGMPRRNSNDG